MNCFQFQLSVLPPLQLRKDEATGLVESFQHYMLRMAFSTGLRHDALFNFIQSGRSPEKVRTVPGSYASWTGPGGNYKELVSRIEAMTGIQGLAGGTFLKVGNVLSPAGMLNPRRFVGRRWCPKCYVDWDDELSFEPLLWCFRLLSRCPMHGCLLEDQCTHCGAAQGHWQKFTSRSSCKKCRRSLSGYGRFVTPSKQQKWLDDRIVAFTRFICDAGPEIGPKAVSDFFAALDLRQRAERDLPHWLVSKLKTGLRSHASKATRAITITDCLNYCAYLGCEIEDIFLSPVEVASQGLLKEDLGFEPIQFGLRRVRNEVANVEEFVIEVLGSSATYIPPWRVVLDIFGVTTVAVNKHAPGVAQAWRDRVRLRQDPLLTREVNDIYRFVLLKLRRGKVPPTDDELIAALNAKYRKIPRLDIEQVVRVCRLLACYRDTKRGEGDVFEDFTLGTAGWGKRVAEV